MGAFRVPDASKPLYNPMATQRAQKVMFKPCQTHLKFEQLTGRGGINPAASPAWACVSRSSKEQDNDTFRLASVQNAMQEGRGFDTCANTATPSLGQTQGAIVRSLLVKADNEGHL